MKARELIEKLQAVDPETEVVACACLYCSGTDRPAVADLDTFEDGRQEITIYGDYG